MISHYEVKAPLRFDADGKPFAIGLDGDKERTPFCWRYKDCQCVGWEDDDGTREQAEKEAKWCKWPLKNGKPCRSPKQVWQHEGGYDHRDQSRYRCHNHSPAARMRRENRRLRDEWTKLDDYQNKPRPQADIADFQEDVQA